MTKKYRVQLTDEQRQQLTQLISSGSAPARKITRARILLKTDENGPGLVDRQVAEALDSSMATVQRVRERFCRQGLEAALERSMPDREYKRALDGRGEARLIALACSEAPEGRSRWTIRLLADKMVELGYVDSLSRETVRRTLKKTSLSLT